MHKFILGCALVVAMLFVTSEANADHPQVIRQHPQRVRQNPQAHRHVCPPRVYYGTHSHQIDLWGRRIIHSHPHYGYHYHGYNRYSNPHYNHLNFRSGISFGGNGFRIRIGF